MILIDRKLEGTMTEGILERHRILEWMRRQVDMDSHHILVGCCGMGKTTETFHLANADYKDRYGYYCLDVCDNDETQFQAYFIEMLKRAGVLKSREELADETLHDTMSNAIQLVNNSQTEYLLIFDELQQLNDEDIIRELLYFVKYTKGSCKTIFVCDGYVPNVWKQATSEGLFHVIRAGSVFGIDRMALVDYLQEMKVDATRAEIDTILKLTMGWPGLLKQLFHSYLIGNRNMGIEGMTSIANEYIYRNIWKDLNENQKKILTFTSMLSYINEDLMKNIMGEDLLTGVLVWLVRTGLMEYKRGEEVFYTNEGIKNFVRRWVIKEGSIELNSYTENLIQYLNRDIASFITSAEQEGLDGMLYLLKGKNLPEVWYLEGIRAANNERYSDLDQWIKKLSVAFRRETDVAKRLHICELLLNLLYVDSRLDAVRWLYRAEEYLEKGKLGKIRLYVIADYMPNICVGTKDLTLFFIDGKKEQRLYHKMWRQLICEEQAVCFEIAEMEYLTETNREKQVTERLQSLLNQGDILREVPNLLGLANVLEKMNIGGYIDEYYSYGWNMFSNQLEQVHNPLIRKNMDANHIYFQSRTLTKEKLAYWVKYDAPQGSERLNRENAFLHLIRAKALFSTGQYPKAHAAFSKLAMFYRNKNKPLYYADSLFGEAACLYALSRKMEALKMATAALTTGAKYRYIGVYCQYGEIGHELIKLYQDMLAGTVKTPGKQKYYYGNILKASFEEYQSILLRSARKEARKMQNADMSYVAEDHLTMTELLILKNVSDGMSNQDIADDMSVALSTVKTHLYSIYKKLGVKSRVAAVNEAKERGML